VFSSSLNCESKYSSTRVSFWLCISLVHIEVGLMKIHYLIKEGGGGMQMQSLPACMYVHVNA
jgi:hypothetical protein